MMMAHFSQAKSLNSTKFRCWLKINPQICCCCVVIHVICSLDKFASCFFSLYFFFSVSSLLRMHGRSLFLQRTQTERNFFIDSYSRVADWREQHSGNVLGPQRQTKTESIFLLVFGRQMKCALLIIYLIFFSSFRLLC